MSVLRGRRRSSRARHANGHDVRMDRGRRTRSRSPIKSLAIGDGDRSKFMTSMAEHATNRAAEALPVRSDRLFRLFRWYARRYCAKYLRAVRLAEWVRPPRLDGPAVIVMNHPSWWDPLIGYVLTGLFAHRVDWGVFESSALKQYRFLGRAGNIGVQAGSPRRAVRFLEVARTILANPNATIWITGQWRFVDARKRPIHLRSGAGHLARQLDRGLIVPLALEMVFWDQRTPEALAAFGSPLICTVHRKWSADQWTAEIESELERTQNRLAADAMGRDPARFTTILRGRAGVGGVYDFWRRMSSWARGKRFDAEHRST